MSSGNKYICIKASTLVIARWSVPTRDEAMNVKRIMKRESNTEAVSPVIGVMLMIVVTIIIAAVVAAFAGGFADSQKKTPSAQLDVQLKPAQDASDNWYSQLVFTHKGGDPLKTQDLRIVTYNTTDGKTILEGSSNAAEYPCKVVNGACDGVNWFGNYTWRNGDILATVDAQSSADLMGSGSLLSQGNVVTVDIVYVPSNTLIFHKDVVSS